jgi:outer membrane protein insertion porin family
MLCALVAWVSVTPALAQPQPGQPQPGQPQPGQPQPGQPQPGQPQPGQPQPGQPQPGQPQPDPNPQPGQPQPQPDPTPDGPVELPKTDAELARGLTIAKVTVSGNQRIPSEDILVYLTGEKIGKEFSPEALHRDVREMWKSLFFEDIQVDLTRKDTECTLRVIVRERASIKALEWEGNKGLDEDDLTEAISAADVKIGSILSYASVRAGVQKVRDKYAEEGFFLAEVDFEVTPAKNNQVVLKFNIHEHEQVSVRRITFVGNNSVPEADLRDVMITGHSSFFDFGSGGSFRQDAFERDILVINALYYDRGFLGVSVATPRVELTQDRTGIEITIPIVEGPRFKIRSIKVYERDADGKEVTPLGGRRALREMIRAKQGDWFNRAELSRDIGAIQTLYRDAGYANVEVPLENEVDPDTNEVDLRMAIQRKKPVKFGRIEIHGNTKTRDKVIRREIEIEEGKLFSETGLARSRERIYRLGYFEKVDITPEQGDDDTTININIDIVEKPTGTFQIGAGFSSIESFIATAQIQQANLFGTGLAFALNASISGLRQQIDFELADPYFLDSKFSGAIHLYDQLRVYDGFSQNSAGGAVTFGYPLVDPEVRLALTYTLENNEISTTTTSTFFGTASAVSVFKKLPLANLFTDGVTSSLRPTITYDSRNNQQFPTKGIYLSGSVEAAPNFLGTENEFYKFTANARFYYPITESIIFRVNSNAGAVVSPDAQGVPIYSRFWLGGIYDLRGFRLRTVGPRLPLRDSLDENASPIPNGQPIGGNLMYYQNVEIEFPIIEAVQVRGVVFTDLGNTWNLEQLYCDAAPASPNAVTNPCFAPDSLLNVRTSVGFGIRWISPLGPLRFEWGFPLKPLAYEEGSVFEFTIGNFF